MIRHYFKIAFRNLLKYKFQSAISMIGLAVGFVCFALSSLWIHYEMTYDSTHEGADRMYVLYCEDILNNSGYSTGSSYPMSTLLKKEFPEVEAACAYSRWNAAEISVEGQAPLLAPIMLSDSCFMNMFGISVLAGNMDFMYTDDKIALTKDMAMRVFGNTKVLGQKVKIQEKEQTVCAILDGVEEHSNLSFGYWGRGEYFRRSHDNHTNTSFTTIVKLREGISPDDFQKKMKVFSDKNEKAYGYIIFKDYKLMPLSKYHYASFNVDKSIEFNYLILFSLAGILVILCSLFNYLSLFFTRLRMRSREMELRKMCGSSTGRLFTMFTIEYLLVILISGFLGMTFLEVTLPMFKKLSGVGGTIYGEASLYFLAVMLLSMLLLLVFISMNHRTAIRGSQYLFRKTSVVFQLAVGILFIFCMSVIMKQVNHLTHTDLGWERENIASFRYIYPLNSLDEVSDKIEQIPYTKEILKGHEALFPKGSAMSYRIDDWEGKEDSVPNVMMEFISEGDVFARFYQLKLLKGEMLKENDKYRIVINETAAKALNIKNPIGQQITGGDKNTYTIIGVMKDFHTTSPTVPVKPTALVGATVGSGGGCIQLKYHESKWEELKAKVDTLFAKEYPQVKYDFINIEDVYAQYLASENILLKLLSFVAVVCVLISVFGIFSLVALTCEQRQREIAIRKVNGARVKDILLMFAKEYFTLLTIAALIAFPVGYVVMKRWLQSYIEQTEIHFAIYAGIYAGIAFIVFLCIGFRVWKAAYENPAETIKN